VEAILGTANYISTKLKSFKKLSMAQGAHLNFCSARAMHLAFNNQGALIMLIYIQARGQALFEQLI